MNVAVLFIVTALVFGIVIALMAVGVMLGRREISGSCGGLGQSSGGEDGPSCSLCSNPDAACKELGRRMQAGSPGGPEAATQPDACEKDCTAEGCSKEAIDACNSR